MTRPKKLPASATKRILPALRQLAVDIEVLQEDPKNARAHPDRNRRTVMESLKRFGQRQALVATESGRVIVGNLRLSVMRELGWKAAAVVRVPDEDADAYAIADNRSAELAEWDDEALAEVLAGLQLDQNLELLDAIGYELEEVEELLGEIGGELEENEDWIDDEPGAADHDQEVDVGVKTNSRGRARQGDEWQLGQLRLLVVEPKRIADALDWLGKRGRAIATSVRDADALIARWEEHTGRKAKRTGRDDA